MESFFFCLTSSCLTLHLVLGGFPRTPPPSASGSWHLQGPLLLLPLHLLIDQILVWNSLMLLQSLSCYFLLPLGSVLSCSHSHSPSASFSNTKIPLSNPNLSPDKYSELHRFHPNLKYFSIVFFFSTSSLPNTVLNNAAAKVQDLAWNSGSSLSRPRGRPSCAVAPGDSRALPLFTRGELPALWDRRQPATEQSIKS